MGDAGVCTAVSSILIPWAGDCLTGRGSVGQVTGLPPPGPTPHSAD